MCLKNGVRLWYNELSHCIGELVEDLAAPFLVQFPVNVSRKVEEDGLSAPVCGRPARSSGIQDLTWHSPRCCGHFRSELVSGRSLCVSTCLCSSATSINKSKS